jgi:hypothetical protein
MHDIKITRKEAVPQNVPYYVRGLAYDYSINGGDTWMTLIQFNNWKDAVTALSWKEYSSLTIYNQVEACLVAYNKTLNKALLGSELIKYIQGKMESSVEDDCDIAFNIITNCTGE